MGINQTSAHSPGVTAGGDQPKGGKGGVKRQAEGLANESAVTGDKAMYY